MSSRIPYPIYAETKLIHLALRIPHHARTILKFKGRDRSEYLKSRWHWFITNLLRTGLPPETKSKSNTPPRETDYFVYIASKYRPPRYSGDVVLFTAESSRKYAKWFWTLMVRGKVRVHPVQGDHGNILGPRNIGNFVELFVQLLNKGASDLR